MDDELKKRLKQEKDTDKLNFNPREEYPVSHKPLIYENNDPASLQIFYAVQYTYLLLESRSTGKSFSLVPSYHALYSTYVALRSITFEKEREGAVCQVMSKPCK